MSDITSVLNKATRLQLEANRIYLSQAGAHEAERVQNRVHSLSLAIGKLQMLARIAHFLIVRTEARIDLSMLGQGYKELAKHAERGFPSNQAFGHAERRLQSTANALAGAIQTEWKAWAEEQLAELDLSRIAMLGQKQQEQARMLLKSLKVTATSLSVDIPQITEFINQHALLSEELQQAPVVPAELLALLNRLNDGGVTLADVDDDEIALLRSHAMDRQIELKRKLS
ncbi:hypothetical protein E1200_04830 [Actinomadura sp. GC306]|uniref:hypothetical protein n=1 Tax=Actinomadura sp. GC306 TaxID=2530367 RepID=UPI0010526727|nr:hypothetical protein [Actinomadura sp. GC306]TDC70563.1 hypothetical protein E1200_04830 [Actinomadura sp. GC306]